MANVKTPIEEWTVKDLEDNSKITIFVESGTELGNNGKPGIQIYYMGNIVCFEPNIVEKWAYQASKAGVTEYLLEDKSWTYHQDQFVKIYLVLGNPLKARVEAKTRTMKAPTVKEYPLPITVEV
jgi:hypothetical protein